MSEPIFTQRHPELDENPFVTFDSNGNGVSRVFDVKWDFHALNQNQLVILFESVDERYRRDIQSYLYALIQWQKENSSSDSHLAVQTLERYKYCLLQLARLWGKSDFRLLSEEREWQKCVKKLEGVIGIEATCKGLASAINALVGAGLVNRYITMKEALKWVDPDAGEGQAIAFPEAIHATILKTVVGFVETYHPYRHQISAAMEKLYAYQDEMVKAELKARGVNSYDALTKQQKMNLIRRMWKKTNKWSERKAIPNFSFNRGGKWLGKLLRMCFTCVGLFSGARCQELLSMNKESYDDSLAAVPKISGFSTKGNKGERISTTWNTAPIAKLALELAFDATQATRKYSSEWIDDGYQRELISEDKYKAMRQDLESAFVSVEIPIDGEEIIEKSSHQFNPKSLNIKAFGVVATAEDVEEFDILNPDREGSLEVGGSLPKLSPHDLRRSFVVFLVKNRLGSALTVKYQLKHRNINMSNWYANYSELARTNQLLMDSNLMAEFDAAIEGSVVDAWDEIYNESETLSGGEGERIAKDKAERLARGEEVVMSRSQLAALVKSGEKSIVLLPTGGYCTNRNCERLCSLMDIVEAPCEHKVITDKAAKRLSRERDNLIASFRVINEMDDFANELILDARKKKIQSIEPTLAKHNVPFENFNDEIKAVWS